MSCEETLRELGLFSFQERRLRGGLVNVDKYLKGGCHEDGDRLFSVVPSNGQILMRRKFCLHMRKKLLTVQVTGHWSKLS